jgi:hypothetical protein
MLQSLNRKRLSLFFLTFVSIVGFGLLLVSRFNATAITPAANAVQGSLKATQTETLQPTEKTELAQSDLTEVQPSEKITSTEQTMPQQGAPGYMSACQNMRQMYVDEHNTKLHEETNRFVAAQQDIINKYNRDGKSFSIAQKTAQAREASRHENIMRQINDQYQKQLKKLEC